MIASVHLAISVGELAEGLFAIVGAALMLVAAIGVVRFPDLYSRMHAGTKAPVVGIAFIAVAAMLSVSSNIPKLILTIVFMFITAPVAAHLLGRSSYRADRVDLELEGPDDLALVVVPDEKEGKVVLVVDEDENPPNE